MARVGTRAAGFGAALAVLVFAVAGCASTSVESFTQVRAKTDATTWTAQAARAVSATAVATTKANGFEGCRSDTGYLPTSSQWRISSDVAVPQTAQAAATDSVVRAFVARGWKTSSKSGVTMLTGPSGTSHRGLIEVQTDGASNLNIEVISPCYK